MFRTCIKAKNKDDESPIISTRLNNALNAARQRKKATVTSIPMGEVNSIGASARAFDTIRKTTQASGNDMRPKRLDTWCVWSKMVSSLFQPVKSRQRIVINLEYIVGGSWLNFVMKACLSQSISISATQTIACTTKHIAR
ncbi:unnamed protein product [Phytophthora lilii]|uniref:Unnamed protein product n=1 Tax=Phytophthora lilii TaxID=2077276 RepID=A0A9W6THV0_9STRA|nr:unnamed protein product [Phytophthora lilii]